MVLNGDPESSSVAPALHFSPILLSPALGPPYSWLKELKSEERGLYLIQLLLYCTNHVAARSLENANIALEHISHLASSNGDTMQRIVAYFSEALADRMVKAWPGLHKAINATNISSVSERILVNRLFFDLIPFLKLACVITNQAIIEAMEGEKVVHIIDFSSFEPAQWISLLEAFSARSEGPPHLIITSINEQKEVLETMGLKLMELAKRLDIPLQFNPIVSKLVNIDLQSLRVKTGQALAISSVLQLHTLLASDSELISRNSSSASRSSSACHLQMNLHASGERDLISIGNPSPCSDSASTSVPNIGSFLSALLGLSPKVMIVTEQEANNNGPTLMERVTEALYFYAALFDCLESTRSRASIERQKVEKFIFGEEIKNIVSCEGYERKERHEKLGKWISLLEMSGFGRVPFNYNVVLQAGRLLQTYGYENYRIREDNGCLFICWQDRPLYSVSAWRCRRYE